LLTNKRDGLEEYSPEKAGGGGSTPSLATIIKPTPNVGFSI